MIFTDTKKLLIITWVGMALLIGVGIGYLLGLRGFGQKTIQGPGFEPGQKSMQQQNFGPGGQIGNQPPQNQNGVSNQGDGQPIR